jgi:hypothetical protein
MSKKRTLNACNSAQHMLKCVKQTICLNDILAKAESSSEKEFIDRTSLLHAGDAIESKVETDWSHFGTDQVLLIKPQMASWSAQLHSRCSPDCCLYESFQPFKRLNLQVMPRMRS